MKTRLVLLSLLAAGTLVAGQPQPKPAEHSVKTTVTPRLNASASATRPTEKPNEIKGLRVTYSGVAVQVAKTKNPAQLINPFAPAEYGSGHQNLDWDIITGKPTGFKFFSISW